MPRKVKHEEKAKPAVALEPAPAPAPAPAPVPVPVPVRPVLPRPTVPRPSPPRLVPASALVRPKPTREELVSAVGQQLLRRSNAWQNSGIRVYDAQDKVILEGSPDFVNMCLTTSDPAYRAMVENAVRVELFAR